MESVWKSINRRRNRKSRMEKRGKLLLMNKRENNIKREREREKSE